jgi:prolyl oligopeptidase
MALILNPLPSTPAEPVTEMLHGIAVIDPYRWLEDQDSPRTRKWLQEQATYSRAYWDAIPGRDPIRQRVGELLSIPSVAEPWNIGNRYFFLKRPEGREQPAIVMRNELFGEETVLIEPALRAGEGSTAVSITAISQNGRFLAYSVRQSGTDHSALEIFDIERNAILPDGLPEGFCTGFAFSPNCTGFFYSQRDLHDLRSQYRAAFWHRFGTERSQDRKIFVADPSPNLYLGILNSPEAQLLAYTVVRAGKRPCNSIYVSALSPEAVPKLLLRDLEGYFVPFFVRDHLLAYTNFLAPNFRIVYIDLAHPDPAHWRDIVPESDRRIQEFTAAGNQIFVTRVDRFSTRIEAFGLDGSRKDDVCFAACGSLNLLNRTSTTDKLFYSHTSISKPATIYCYDARNENSSVWDEPNVPFDPSMIAVEEVTYTSKDGTSVPLLLAARNDLLHSGPLPVFLTGYGGFGSCVTPRFTALATYLIEQGFLFAVPALRGGAELGEQWHLAGRRGRRQNSFNDCIAAAEWLLSQGRSEQDRIALGGGSNAGLLVGAAITQRPDLFRAAICLGPMLDMTRFHLFDFAARWEDEYGSPEDEQDFRSLLAYSPYHRVEDGVRYPAVLLISGDADTRCNPMHTRKMAARLQTASSSGYPILLDYRPAWGHMPVQPLSTKIQALTDRLAFICHELGVHVQPRRFS